MTSAPAPTPVAPPVAAASRRRRRGREVLRQPLALLGLTIALTVAIAAANLLSDIALAMLDPRLRDAEVAT